MKIKIAIVALAFLAMTIMSRLSQAGVTKTDVTERMQDAAKVLNELTNAGDKGIPDEVLHSAKCVAVLPSMIKGAFVLGGEHGGGVATCRLPDGHWSAPAFFTISGGSWGLQIGVQDVQLVIMAMNEEGMRHMMNEKFQVGGEASAAAGPVGRHASAGTDWKLNTQFLTYSRTKGVFAGIDLSGSWIARDKKSTEAEYGNDLTNGDLLDGKTPPPPEAHVFLSAVRDAQVRKQSAQK